VDVTFSIDSDGILTVTAKDQKTGAVANIEIKNRSQMNKDQLDKLVKEAERFRADDEQRLKRVEAKNELERVINEVMEVSQNLSTTKSADGDVKDSKDGKEVVKKGKTKAVGVNSKKAESNKKLGDLLEQAAMKAQQWLEDNPDAKPGEIGLQRRALENRIQNYRKP